MTAVETPLLRTDLDGVFRPRSVAIYGISERTSLRIAENMTVPGVPFYGINPTKTEACGVTCYPTMADLPEVPEMVVMGVGHGRIEAAIDDVLSVPGVRAIITPGLGNEAAWIALERKGLVKSHYPLACVLTPAGIAYETGLKDEILHEAHHH